jgi:hypothetical protein
MVTSYARMGRSQPPEGTASSTERSVDKQGTINGLRQNETHSSILTPVFSVPLASRIKNAVEGQAQLVACNARRGNISHGAISKLCLSSRQSGAIQS